MTNPPATPAGCHPPLALLSPARPRHTAAEVNSELIAAPLRHGRTARRAACNCAGAL